MMRTGDYAIYQGKEYKFLTSNSNYRLLTREKAEIDKDFEEAREGFYTKAIKLTELEYAYRTYTWCQYEGYEFQIILYSETKDEYEIVGSTENLIKELGFEFWERGAYRKRLHIEDMDSLYEIRTPLFDFEIPEEYRNNPGNHPNEYIVPIIENAKK